MRQNNFSFIKRNKNKKQKRKKARLQICRADALFPLISYYWYLEWYFWYTPYYFCCFAFGYFSFIFRNIWNLPPIFVFYLRISKWLAYYIFFWIWPLFESVSRKNQFSVPFQKLIWKNKSRKRESIIHFKISILYF